MAIGGGHISMRVNIKNLEKAMQVTFEIQLFMRYVPLIAAIEDPFLGLSFNRLIAVTNISPTGGWLGFLTFFFMCLAFFLGIFLADFLEPFLGLT